MEIYLYSKKTEPWPPEDIRSSVSPNVAYHLPLSSPYGTKHYVGSDTTVIGQSYSSNRGEFAYPASVGKSDTAHSKPASGPGYNKSS